MTTGAEKMGKVAQAWMDENGFVSNPTAQYYCGQCNKEMSIMQHILGAVCLACCRKNHRKVLGR